MLVSAAICLTTGLCSLFWARGAKARIARREALIIVASAWLGCSIFGGIPYMIGSGFSISDAIFEATSGFTTTGATILPEIEQRLSPPLLFWRMATHWLGGLGIVVLFVALFPALGVGGKHLFRTEAPGPKTDSLAPRIRQSASALWKIYLALTFLVFSLLAIAGMPIFDALTHAFSTMATGGYSTRNASVGAYDNLAIEVIITVFMLVAGTNFGLFHEAIRRGPRVFVQNTEFRVFLGLFLLVSAIIVADILSLVGGIGNAVRYATFQVAAIMTGTGFGTADFEQWPSLSKSLLVLLYFFGGSAGSTAGGMKLVRIIIVVRLITNELRRAYRPALVTVVRVGQHAVRPPEIIETFAYLMVFLLTVGVGGVVVSMLENVDLTTAFMAALACVANVGPGLGEVGPTDNYGFFGGTTKVFLSSLMLLGRLEFFALLTLFVPDFWRR